MFPIGGWLVCGCDVFMVVLGPGWWCWVVLLVGVVVVVCECIFLVWSLYVLLKYPYGRLMAGYLNCMLNPQLRSASVWPRFY